MLIRTSSHNKTTNLLLRKNVKKEEKLLNGFNGKYKSRKG